MKDDGALYAVIISLESVFKTIGRKDWTTTVQHTLLTN